MHPHRGLEHSADKPSVERSQDRIRVRTLAMALYAGYGQHQNSQSTSFLPHREWESGAQGGGRSSGLGGTTAKDQALRSDARMQAQHFPTAKRSMKSDRSIHTHKQKRCYKQAVQHCTPRNSTLSPDNSVNRPDTDAKRNICRFDRGFRHHCALVAAI